MSNILDFFKQLFAWIKSELKKAPQIQQDIVKLADAITNGVKTIQGNQTVQFLENTLLDILETAAPALKPYLDGLILELPKIAGLIANVSTEASKTDAELLNELLIKLETISGLNKTAYAGDLTTLNAAIQAYFTNNMGIQVTPAELIVHAVAEHAA